MSGSQRWNRDRLLGALKRFHAEHGRLPRQSEFDGVSYLPSNAILLRITDWTPWREAAREFAFALGLDPSAVPPQEQALPDRVRRASELQARKWRRQLMRAIGRFHAAHGRLPGAKDLSKGLVPGLPPPDVVRWLVGNRGWSAAAPGFASELGPPATPYSGAASRRQQALAALAHFADEHDALPRAANWPAGNVSKVTIRRMFGGTTWEEAVRTAAGELGFESLPLAPARLPNHARPRRNERLAWLHREQGLDFTEIARLMGITRERTRQLARRAGVSPDESRRIREESQSKPPETRAARLHYEAKLTVSEIATVLGVNRQVVRTWIQGHRPSAGRVVPEAE